MTEKNHTFTAAQSVRMPSVEELREAIADGWSLGNQLYDDFDEMMRLRFDAAARAAVALAAQPPAAPVETDEDEQSPWPVEIWHGDRKVSIYSDSVHRIWGPNMDTHMTDEQRTHETVAAAVDWLYAVPHSSAATGDADDYEKRIREKVFNSGILTNGEWVYLVGLFQTAREAEGIPFESVEAAKAYVEDSFAQPQEAPTCPGKGWLAPALESAERRAAEMPDWMRRDKAPEDEGELVVTQYQLMAAQSALREIAGMSHNCRSVDIAKAALAMTRPQSGGGV